ncbi:MAG: malectin domain-containing carbohydrate-binding protein, partial [Bacteroidota bacterium]
MKKTFTVFLKPGFYKKLRLLLLLLMVGGFSNVLFAQADLVLVPTGSVTTTQMQVNNNATLSFDVEIRGGATQFSAVEFYLSFDPAILGNPVVVAPNPNPFTLSLTQGSLPSGLIGYIAAGNTLSGTVKVATVTFDVIGVGTTLLEFGDPDGTGQAETKVEDDMGTDVLGRLINKLILDPINGVSINAGQTVNVTATAVNNGESAINFAIEIEDDGDNSIVPSSDYTFTNGQLTWNTQSADAGNYTATVTASDNIDSEEKSFSIEIITTETSPVISPINNQSVDEGGTLNLMGIINISDGDGDNLTVSITSASNEPEHLQSGNSGNQRDPFPTDASGFLAENNTTNAGGTYISDLTFTPTFGDGSSDGFGSGVYTVTVSVDDEDGNTVTETFDLTVNDIAQPIADDGSKTRIEAESYDDQGPDGTNDGIGVEVDNGFTNIGFTNNSDFAEYVINVTTAGTYQFDFSVAKNSNASHTMTINGGPASIEVPNNGNWTSYSIQTVNVELPAGQQTLRFDWSGGGGFYFNMDWFELTYLPPAPLEAMFNITPNPAGCSSEVTFNGNASTSPGTITSYEWDFDYDGNTFNVDDTGVEVKNTFNTIGSQDIALRVTDDNNDIDIEIISLSLTSSSPISVAGGPYSITFGDGLSLDGSGSSDADIPCGDALTYAWDLDGNDDFLDASGISPSLTAMELDNLGLGIGSHTIKLKVTDNQANENISTATLTINPQACNIKYRINAGGPLTNALNGNFEADQSGSGANGSASNGTPSIYYKGSVDKTFGSGTAVTGVPMGYPEDIFKTERFSDGPDDDMKWEFPANGVYQVNLLFNESWSQEGNSGNNRIFDVFIEGNKVLEDYRPSMAAGGANIAVIESFQVTVTDGTLNLGFVRENQNPAIKGIEICIISEPANNPPVVNITAPNNNDAFDEGTSVTFTGTVSDTEDGNGAANLAWTSDLDGSIGTGATFNKSDLSIGTHTITATQTDAGGLTSSASISVVINATVNQNPVVNIIAPTDMSNVEEGNMVSLNATATDPEDGNVANSLVWISDLDGTIGTTGTDVSTLSVGTHTITAKATDSGNLMGEASVVVVVQPTAEACDLLFRVNAGGSGVTDWENDTGNNNNQYLAEPGTNQTFNNSSNQGYKPIMATPLLPFGTPLTLFETERYDVDNNNNPENLLYQFPVANGTEVEVRLFFAEIFTGIDAAGERVFDVSVEG